MKQFTSAMLALGNASLHKDRSSNFLPLRSEAGLLPFMMQGLQCPSMTVLLDQSLVVRSEGWLSEDRVQQMRENSQDCQHGSGALQPAFQQDALQSPRSMDGGAMPWCAWVRLESWGSSWAPLCVLTAEWV